VSRRRFEADYEAVRDQIQADNEAAKEEALARAERIFQYRKIRLTALIEDQDSWIRDKEVAGSDRERRVLPARRGQLAKNRERLATLELEHQDAVEAIKRRQPGASATVLAAGVVIGE
jgi:cell division protein FtsB